MLHISIITPEKTVLEAEADEIIIPTIEGEIAVLPEHVPLLSQVGPGELIIKKGNNEDHLAVMGGFLEISHDKVTILADYAAHGRDISAVKAEEAKTRAEKAMKEGVSQKDYALAEAELQKAMLELKVANKMKHRNSPSISG